MALRVASRDSSEAVVGFPTRCPTPGSSLVGGMPVPLDAARDVYAVELLVLRSGRPNTFSIGE